MSCLLTNTVIWDLDGAGRSPAGGVDKQTERHHPQGQDRGTSCHTDTEEERTWRELKYILRNTLKFVVNDTQVSH